MRDSEADSEPSLPSNVESQVEAPSITSRTCSALVDSLPAGTLSLPSPVPSSRPASSRGEAADSGADSDVELPPGSDDADSETDAAANGFDDAIDLLSDAEYDEVPLQLDTAAELQPPVRVPTPAVAKLMPATSHCFAEYYSPPRVALILVGLGLLVSLCLDTLTGWDFDWGEQRVLSLHLLVFQKVGFLMASPPCTAFCALQALWNFKKLPPQRVAAIWRKGMVYLAHAAECCRVQHNQGRLFGLEHPASATSWKQDVITDLAALPGVYAVTFDQCMLGIKSPSGRPMRKRTRILTNSKHLVAQFSNLHCDKSHEHCLIQGSECGIKLSTFAQIYPREMCLRIAKAVQLELNR